VGGRTFVIGDIHGDLAALDRLLGKLPATSSEDTVVFLGDYLDRGPDPKGVVDRVRTVGAGSKARTVYLRGNHEDKWVQSYDKPDLPYLLQWGNGCAQTFRSYSGGKPLQAEESLDIPEIQRMIEVNVWMPAEVQSWMSALPLWYEDEHAVYVHAGLERDSTGGWKHPRDSAPKPLLWMRERAFFKGYRGKRLCFGHTPIAELPLSADEKDPSKAWVHGDLIGLDTGCGKGGFLSAVELPAMTFYDSR
jgi:serine/threonine protein phosphatase 1